MNGLVLLDKPEGYTSFKAVAALRRIYGTKRAGHTGTLDPLATGVLPVLIGRATRLCSFVLEADKKYTAGVRLGVVTDTLDITGNVLSRSEPDVSDGALLDALEHFTGEYNQTPPMFSAVKVDGKRLYDLARNGVTVERRPRRVNIKEITLIGRAGNDFTVDVLCSKGTYIRSLADDIGRYLGCGAVITSLRRTATAQFDISQCAALEQIESDPGRYLLSAEAAVGYLKRIDITGDQKRRFLNGADLTVGNFEETAGTAPDELLIVKCGGEFLGLGKYCGDGLVRTKCVVTD